MEIFRIKIAYDETNINIEQINKYFGYHNPSFLVLYNSSETRNKKIVNNVNDALIDLTNTVNKEETP